jgi:hypothetical protein
MFDISTLRWHVFAGGYVCDNHVIDGKKTRCIAPNVMEAREFFLKERFPLKEDPALFRKFAATELTEKGVLSFANDWGPLWEAHDMGDQFLDPDFEEENICDFTWTYVPVESWYEEIKTMRALIELWDVLGSRKEKKLSEVLDIKREADRDVLQGDVRFKSMPELRWHYFFHEDERPSGVRELAGMCLLYHINGALWDTCSPWLRNGHGRDEGISSCLIPHNLDAALWLMFAQEILGEKKLKQCSYCKRHFELTAEKDERRGRSDKKYCSPKCRAAAFRDRMENAPVRVEQKTKGKRAKKGK